MEGLSDLGVLLTNKGRDGVQYGADVEIRVIVVASRVNVEPTRVLNSCEGLFFNDLVNAATVGPRPQWVGAATSLLVLLTGTRFRLC